MVKPNDLRGLIDLTKTTQTLLTHFQSSLASSSGAPNASDPQVSSADIPNSLEVVKTCTTLLRSHTTTLSLLLLTPPLTPSALITKIGDVSSGALSGLVAAAISTPQAGQKDELGVLMRGEVKAQVRRLIGTWDDVLAIVQRLSEKRQTAQGKGKTKDEGPTESERQDVLAATGVVWEACDALLKLCTDGVVGLVIKKAQELRSVLLDAIEELKEWGEDVDNEDDDKAECSAGEFDNEDEIFGAANKLGKGDKELKALLDTSVKKLKMVGLLYQALIKRRLKTFSAQAQAQAAASASGPATNGDAKHASINPVVKLDELMVLLKAIPETADDLASAFYDLDEDEAKRTLDKCSGEAKSAVALVKKSWTGADDEFTVWSGKWVDAFDAA
ncbi:hypothetical protein K458DRAFT_415349 [Lentithecium fluviatile CBS 122367]|uniref:Cyclin-D1-binding protein 1-like N-terminal domain-containing protein n=1 Tax=Lentithecium fluviatile CBS 122367 TaxID=1168545 RepID=A0A6G1J955_9PLEO|nr:hypothetical protein K458DRAFT_415349 [Lentithecium fluviatile CBS 122367]